jgi:hypothetical protein
MTVAPRGHSSCLTPRLRLPPKASNLKSVGAQRGGRSAQGETRIAACRPSPLAPWSLRRFALRASSTQDVRPNSFRSSSLTFPQLTFPQPTLACIMLQRVLGARHSHQLTATLSALPIYPVTPARWFCVGCVPGDSRPRPDGPVLDAPLPRSSTLAQSPITHASRLRFLDSRLLLVYSWSLVGRPTHCKLQSGAPWL